MRVKYQNENFNGAYDFRCRRHDGWYMSANLHEYSEILYCEGGEGVVVVNGQRIDLGEGQLVWIPPNYIHKYECKNAKLICAVFSNDLIPLFFKSLAGRYFRVSAIDAAEIGEFLEMLPQLTRQDFLQVSGYLNLICAAVMKRSQFESARPTDGHLYQKVISYIADHYAEDITLEEISRLFGYNKKYLSHTLHALTGIHFRRLLAFYRVEHARRLLVSAPEQSISNIALSCGFSAINTFHRAFREQTGMHPSEYRKQYGG